jgi:hypothetical protein
VKPSKSGYASRLGGGCTLAFKPTSMNLAPKRISVGEPRVSASYEAASKLAPGPESHAGKGRAQRRESLVPIVELNGPLGDALDRVTDDDRIYFEAHSEQRWRCRQADPAERAANSLLPGGSTDPWVLVIAAPSRRARIRIFIPWPTRPEGSPLAMLLLQAESEREFWLCALAGASSVR